MNLVLLPSFALLAGFVFGIYWTTLFSIKLSDGIQLDKRRLTYGLISAVIFLILSFTLIRVLYFYHVVFITFLFLGLARIWRIRRMLKGTRYYLDLWSIFDACIVAVILKLAFWMQSAGLSQGIMSFEFIIAMPIIFWIFTGWFNFNCYKFNKARFDLAVWRMFAYAFPSSRYHSIKPVETITKNLSKFIAIGLFIPSVLILGIIAYKLSESQIITHVIRVTTLINGVLLLGLYFPSLRSSTP